MKNLLMHNNGVGKRLAFVTLNSTVSVDLNAGGKALSKYFERVSHQGILNVVPVLVALYQLLWVLTFGEDKASAF